MRNLRLLCHIVSRHNHLQWLHPAPRITPRYTAAIYLQEYTSNFRSLHYTSTYLEKETYNTPTRTTTAPVRSKPDKDFNVTVISEDGEDIGVMTKREAELSAKEEGLKLVLINERDNIYQLMTGKRLADERKRLREGKQGQKKPAQKTVKINPSISDHDLTVKVKNIQQWLEKGHVVKVAVALKAIGSDQAASAVFQKVSASFKGVAIVKEANRSKQALTFNMSPIQTTEKSTRDEKLRPLSVEQLKTMKTKLGLDKS